MALLSLSEFELGWVSGLLDGEGSFGLGSSAHRKDEPTARTLIITCGMTDPDTIERLKSVTGIGNVNTEKRRDPRRANSKQMYIWQVGRRADVVALLQAIQPHMSTRRQARIQELLDHHAGHPIRYKRDLPCGTSGKYNRGCRCDECLPVGRAHNAEKSRKHRRKKHEEAEDQAAA